MGAPERERDESGWKRYGQTGACFQVTRPRNRGHHISQPRAFPIICGRTQVSKITAGVADQLSEVRNRRRRSEGRSQRSEIGVTNPRTEVSGQSTEEIMQIGSAKAWPDDQKVGIISCLGLTLTTVHCLLPSDLCPLFFDIRLLTTDL